MQATNDKSNKTCLILALLSLLGSLACLGWSWQSYDQGRASVQAQIAQAGARQAAEQAMTRMGEVGAGITLWLGLAGAFLVFGVAMLALGLLRPPKTEEKSKRPWSSVAATLLVAAGFGLGLVAFVDYLRFEDFFTFLLMFA